jgi:hypothetical protein
MPLECRKLRREEAGWLGDGLGFAWCSLRVRNSYTSAGHGGFGQKLGRDDALAANGYGIVHAEGMIRHTAYQHVPPWVVLPTRPRDRGWPERVISWDSCQSTPKTTCTYVHVVLDI